MEELQDLFKETFQGAQEEEEKERFRNSIILYSKALFSLCDIIIFVKLQKLPKNHSERFRILEQYFPETYDVVDELFSSYTDAYSKPAKKETLEKIKNGIKTISKNKETPETTRELLEQRH